VKNRVLPILRDLRSIGKLSVGHHERDFASEMLLVEAKGLRAVPAVVEIGV
jgi:hypothetical protein